ALAQDPNVAAPHTTVHDTVRAIPWHNIDNIGPAGSINSSARDMAEWVRLQLGRGTYKGRALISSANVDEMHSPQTVIPMEPWLSSASPVNHQMVPGSHFFLYGMGWFLQDYKGHKLVHHGGSIDGMRALVGMAPEERLGLVVLTNLNPSSIDEAVMFRIFDEYLGGEKRDWSQEILAGVAKLEAGNEAARRRREASRVAGTSPSLPLARYAGTYADSAYGDAVVREEGEKLVVQFGRTTGDLEHWHYDTFQITWRTATRDRALATFRLDAKGAP